MTDVVTLQLPRDRVHEARHQRMSRPVEQHDRVNLPGGLIDGTELLSQDAKLKIENYKLKIAN